MDESGRLSLDLDTIRTKKTPIDGWPHGIRAALQSLQINDD